MTRRESDGPESPAGQQPERRPCDRARTADIARRAGGSSDRTATRGAVGRIAAGAGSSAGGRGLCSSAPRVGPARLCLKGGLWGGGGGPGPRLGSMADSATSGGRWAAVLGGAPGTASTTQITGGEEGAACVARGAGAEQRRREIWRHWSLVRKRNLTRGSPTGRRCVKSRKTGWLIDVRRMPSFLMAVDISCNLHLNLSSYQPYQHDESSILRSV